MSTILHKIVSDIGGALSHGGMRATCPAPGHSAADRSMSLLLGPDGEIVVNSFSTRTDWQECRRFLEDRGYIQQRQHQPSALRSTMPRPPAGPDPLKLARVNTLWQSATATLKTPVAAYLNKRQLEGTYEHSEALRYLSRCDHRPYGSKFPPFRFSPAMLAPICDGAGARIGLHITFLDPATGYRRRADPSRKIIGQMRGGAIQLQAASDTLLVAEGIETALSAGRRFETPAWSLISSVNMTNWTPPANIRKLVIAGDSNQAGRDAAEALAERASNAGIRVALQIAPGEFSDWNEFDTRCG